MSSVLKNSFSNRRKTIYGQKMGELTPQIYKELLRYNSIQKSSWPQLIDLATYRQEDFKKAA